MEFRSYLDRKLRQAFSEEWDLKRPTRVEMIQIGDLIGLRFLVRRRDASWAVVYEESPVALETTAAVDEMLARALSMFLMKHPGWPRCSDGILEQQRIMTGAVRKLLVVLV